MTLPTAPAPYQLIEQAGRLELRDTRDPKLGPLYVDFAEGKARHRLLFGGGKGQDIAKAIGLHKLKHIHVLDATAGLGQEAFVLASLGCQVTLLERVPIIHALLQDGLRRAALQPDPTLQLIVSRMHLHHAEAREWLAGSDLPAPDVIYLDPMFPERQKAAQVQKAMRFLHDIAGIDTADGELLQLARARALQRVVVKRPRLAPLLAPLEPAFVIKGKTVRYDVYLPLTKTAA